MKKFIILASMVILLQACTGSRTIDVKSPCVSSEGGPCDPRKPVNAWLIDYKV